MSHADPRLNTIFSPKSLAIVGASRQEGKIGHTLLANALGENFAGPIYPVNPHGGEILGKQTVTSISALPRGIDLVVLAVAAPLIQEQARLAISRGCSALVVVADGFRETSEEGAKRESELAKLCQERQVLLLGPNSLGVIHKQHSLNISLTLASPPVGGISLLSQSGAVCAAALDWLSCRQLGIAKMISLGNEAGVTDAQCMSYLAHDPHTKVIACYLEWVTDGSGFLKAATEASRSKPVVMLLGGSSEWRKRSAIRHSGFLPHSPTVFAAACDRTGVVQTTDFQSWMDAVMAFSLAPLAKGNRVAIITNGGGPGLLTSDVLDRHGLLSVGLAEQVAEPLKGTLTSRASLIGPLDLCGVALPHHYQATVDACMRDESLDAALTVVTPQALTRPMEIVQTLPNAKSFSKPLFMVLMGGGQMRPAMNLLAERAIPGYPTPERAAAAFAALDHYSRWRRRGPRIISQFNVNRSRARRLIQRCHMLNIYQLSDLESKEVLQAYGVAIPEGEEAVSVFESQEMAERLGYPVNLHLLSPELHLAHDMETRHLNVANPQGVQDAFDLLTLRFAKKVPEGRLTGIFVEKVLTHGRHISMGMNRDWQFGPFLQVADAEHPANDDSLSQLAPITGEEAMTMLHNGCRQKKMGDLCDEMNESELQAVAEVLQRISQLATDFPEISHIRIASLVIRRAGLPPVATDCVIFLQTPEEAP
ncbi:MAG: hypothetical protein G8345_22250 [Magnetococcales bacterium]|nr:hypothetical protein [Magnetococcales bacterium]